jgi:molecular chaperone Hsp33
MVAAAALLSANLKFNGAIVMQIHGDGPVRLLVVECDSDLRLRATAKLARTRRRRRRHLTELLNVRTGKGRFVITLDPLDKMPGQQPYQGIVPLDGDDMATVIENYMLRSEQLDTRLWLAADDRSRAACCCKSCRATAARTTRPCRPAKRKTWKPGTAP